MAKKRGDDGEKDALWQMAMADVRPLGKSAKPAQKADENAPPATRLILEKVARTRKPPQEARGRETDRNTLEKLRRGRMPIEGRLDLHGETRDAAQQKIRGFLLRAHKAGKRCVLVITGKGNRTRAEGEWWEGKSVTLRSLLPLWLDEDPLKKIVLAHVPARPEDGGTGAFYILLRRHR